LLAITALISTIGAAGDGGCGGDGMSTYPPGGWSVDAGTWGTDMDRETSVVEAGANAIHYIDTATTSVRVASDYYPVVAGSPYRISALMQQDDISSQDVTFSLAWFTAAKGYISGTFIFKDNLPDVDTWYELSGILNAPSTARFARILLGRATASFNAYSAYAKIEPHPVCFDAYLSAASTNYNKAAAVVCDTELFDYGSAYATGTGLFTAPADGIYTFNAQITVTLSSAGEWAAAWFWHNGAAVKGITAYAVGHAASAQVVSSGSITILMARGETMGILAGHSGAIGTRAYAGGTTRATHFSGFKVE